MSRMNGDETIIPIWLLIIVWGGAYVLWGKYLDWRERKKRDRARKDD